MMTQFNVFWNRKEARNSVITVGASQRTSALLIYSIDDIHNFVYILTGKPGFINTLFPPSPPQQLLMDTPVEKK